MSSQAPRSMRQFRAVLRMLSAILPFYLGPVAAPGAASVPAEPAPPSSPRDFFNAGTQKLRDGKLREAEAFLETALTSQNERFQPPSLYNLGHVRFGQGVQELKKGPSAKPTAARGRAAAQMADGAIDAADSALASN